MHSLYTDTQPIVVNHGRRRRLRKKENTRDQPSTQVHKLMGLSFSLELPDWEGRDFDFGSVSERGHQDGVLCPLWGIEHSGHRMGWFLLLQQGYMEHAAATGKRLYSFDLGDAGGRCFRAPQVLHDQCPSDLQVHTFIISATSVP